MEDHTISGLDSAQKEASNRSTDSRQSESDSHVIKEKEEDASVERQSDVESKAFDETLLGTPAEKRLIRKLDFALLPLFTLVYCCNFIDRTAIGNARIAGLEKDLGMKGLDFNKSLTVFYVFYILVEVPSNLALKRFGSIWIAFLVFSFGVIALGTAFVKSYAGLVVTRVFLGLAEGGTLSGLVYCLSRYYRRHELVWRIGIFFGLSPSLAGAFGGLLASGLLSVNDIGSLNRWRKIFLIEGIITMGIGLFLMFFMPGDPTTTKLLNEEERAIAITRLDADNAIKTRGKMERTTMKLVWHSMNFNTMLCSTAYMLINISFQGLSLFLPTVINSLGHFTTVEAQLRTVPPFLVGAVWALICAYMSFHFNQRCIPIILSVLLMVIGYALAVGTVNAHARYAACFFAVAGGGPSAPLYLTWGTDNAAPETMRAVATALIPGLGQIGAIIAVWTYLPSDAPNYHKGNSLNLATSCAVCVITALGGLYIRWENKKRDRGERDRRLEDKTKEEIEQLGYLHPNFRYQM
ncbi:MFS general substrate transporter [Panaeolus papilionaceus]|nr:MFS general substrate transporter [Panaeolus papilionaceus]